MTGPADGAAPRAPGGAGSRLAWTALFGVAFGWVEAAVVVYLRRVFYADGFAFPLRRIDPFVLRVECAREAATLVMLAAVACLAGRRAWERFGCFLVAFGIWDLVYYAGLKIALGWPASWTEPDVLFLLPRPWVGPVYAPASVAVLMTAAGAATAIVAARGRSPRLDAAIWLLAVAGCAVVLWSFLGDAAAAAGAAAPRAYPWPALVVGEALLAAAAWRCLRRGRAPAAGEGA